MRANEPLPSPLRTWTKPQTKPQTESLEKNGGTPPQALGFRGLAEPDYPPPTYLWFG